MRLISSHDYHRFTEFALRRYCERAGLKIISIEPYGGGPEVLLDTFGKMLTVSRTTRRLLPLYSRLALAVQTLSLVKKVSIATAQVLPLGYYLVAEKLSGACKSSHSRNDIPSGRRRTISVDDEV